MKLRRIGQTLALGVPINPTVTLRCGQVPLMHGRLGRVQDRMAVRVEERVKIPREVGE